MNYFKKIKKAGIIYVMDEAMKEGFSYTDKNWINLGQGSAEAGDLASAPKRKTNIKSNGSGRGYAPVSGLKKLREQTAEVYNDFFRQDKKQFGFKNVSIAGGGRACLTRIFSCLGLDAKVGYFSPDYAGYEGLLESFPHLQTEAVFLQEKKGFKISAEELEKEFISKKINVFLLSNPSNPLGSVIRREELRKLVDVCKRNNILLVADEFYFNYVYNGGFETVSACEFIDDPNKENVLIISGLSKSWRYAGWRIAWVLGPEKLVEDLGSAGSYLDGGANRPLQEEALSFVNSDNLRKETKAIQKEFLAKRDFMLAKLEKMGFVVKNKPQGAFYIWASLENMPTGLDGDMNFFRECLKEKVIVVPGRFFDINPGGKRKTQKYKKYIRLSFGPDMESLKEGVSRIEKLLGRFV